MGKMNLDRRTFMKAGLATGAVAAAGASVAFADEPPAAGEFLTAADTIGKKWAFEIAPEGIALDSVAETIEADLIVVGAGTSGLVCANSATDEGLNVIVVSASAGPVSRGGSNSAVHSKAIDRLGRPKASPWIVEKEMFAAGSEVDPRKWWKFYNHSEEAMNWAIDLMEEAGYEVGIERGVDMDPDSLFFIAENSHGWLSDDVRSPAMGQPFFVQQLTQRLIDMGGRVDFLTIGRQLVRGGVANGTEGRVEGIICEREDGSYAYYVGTKAVVLATGDFSADPDMMAKYAPQMYDTVDPAVFAAGPNYDAPFIYGGLMKGDGQKMGLWIGAAWQRTYPNAGMGFHASGAGPASGYACHWGLMVDRNGKRFMNEYGASATTNFIVAHLEGQVCGAIWDIGYAENIGTHPMSLTAPPVGEFVEPTVEEMVADWDLGVEEGRFVKGDTIEEVIEKMGLPMETTMATVERYNEMARAGEDTEFYKRSDVLFPIEKGPFYGAMSAPMPMILTVLGGLRTNADMQVCDEADNPIEGLYNVGTMIGDSFASGYTFMVCGANYGMNCITMGYLTGKYIAANE